MRSFETFWRRCSSCIVFSNFVSSWCSVSWGVMVFSAFVCVKGGVGRALSLFVGCPTANPSSRRKEKASRTEKFLLACWCCLQPQLPSRHKT